jgi:hypothetical protein
LASQAFFTAQSFLAAQSFFTAQAFAHLPALHSSEPQHLSVAEAFAHLPALHFLDPQHFAVSQAFLVLHGFGHSVAHAAFGASFGQQAIGGWSALALPTPQEPQ